jgi:dTMP kinase
MKKGIFIVIEGNDGSGKTTQINLLKEKLIPKYGDNIVFTREPGGIDICERIRDIIMDDGNTNMNPVTELLLFAASRAQLVADVIKPALEAGKVVICDRYIHSTMAYQGFGRGMDLDMINRICEYAIQDIEPDLVIWLRTDPEEALKRRGTDLNRMDKNGLEFNKRVEDGYKTIWLESMDANVGDTVVDIFPGDIVTTAGCIEFVVSPLLVIYEHRRREGLV